eukprot:m51a1_g12213 hypothetical protein (319) ;mRNA; f:14111-16046
MGQLLSALINGTRNVEEIFLDFDNAKPSETELELWTQINSVLERGPVVLQKLLAYRGCEEAIRKAITTPSQETEEAAWNMVLPAVDQLQEFYEFSLALEQNFPKLIVALCKDDPKASLANQQALAKQLGDVFDFVLRFDESKMINPAIQNDFSYYRRTLSRMKLAKKDTNIKIRDELANRMSLFFAYPTPMMKVLSETTVKFLSNGSSAADAVTRDKVTTALSAMANICHDMVENKKFPNSDTNMFCLRTMTGAVILYDHVSEAGAFCKKSPINIKQMVQCLRGYTGSSTDGLVNALRFTTVHLNDADTPSTVKQILS